MRPKQPTSRRMTSTSTSLQSGAGSLPGSTSWLSAKAAVVPEAMPGCLRVPLLKRTARKGPRMQVATHAVRDRCQRRQPCSSASQPGGGKPCAFEQTATILAKILHLSGLLVWRLCKRVTKNMYYLVTIQSSCKGPRGTPWDHRLHTRLDYKSGLTASLVVRLIGLLLVFANQQISITSEMKWQSFLCRRGRKSKTV